MAVLKILQYPHPLLKSRSRQVHTIDDRITRIIQDLLDTLASSPGVALAAPQIGEPYRIIVCDGYPRNVLEGFLDKMIGWNDDVDISIHIEPFPIETTISISRSASLPQVAM